MKHWSTSSILVVGLLVCGAPAAARAQDARQLQTLSARANPLACGVDLEALGAYLRAGRGTGAAVGAPTVGQSLYFHLDYRVIGASETVNARAVAMLDGEMFCAVDPAELELGRYGTIFCPMAWRATEGPHTLRWEIDADGAVAETDEGNNAAEVTFIVARATGVDLEASRVYLRTGVYQGPEVAHPTVGQDVYLQLDYRLTGSSDALSANLMALVDEQPYCAGPFLFQPGGVQPAACGVPWTAVAGVHSLIWVIDPDDTVAEANELNNAAELRLVVPAPAGIDFQAQRAYLRSAAQGGGDEVAAPMCGMSVYLHFDYALAGTAAPVSAELRALIDGLLYCFGPFPFTPDPDDFAYCTTPWIAAPGRHTLRWEIDYTDDLPETDEHNNAAEVTFYVGGATPCAGDCNRDGTVSIADVIVAVQIALGGRPVDDCRSLDADGDGRVTVNELIVAVHNALNGCTT